VRRGKGEELAGEEVRILVGRLQVPGTVDVGGWGWAGGASDGEHIPVG
jgi:hypothetical protein